MITYINSDQIELETESSQFFGDDIKLHVGKVTYENKFPLLAYIRDDLLYIRFKTLFSMSTPVDYGVIQNVVFEVFTPIKFYNIRPNFELLCNFKLAYDSPILDDKGKSFLSANNIDIDTIKTLFIEEMKNNESSKFNPIVKIKFKNINFYD